MSLTEEARKATAEAARQLRKYGVTDLGMALDCADPANVPPPKFADLSAPKRER